MHRVFEWVVILRDCVYGADGAVHGTIRTVQQTNVVYKTSVPHHLPRIFVANGENVQDK